MSAMGAGPGPDRWKELEIKLTEVCQQHQESIQRCFADFVQQAPAVVSPLTLVESKLADAVPNPPLARAPSRQSRLPPIDAVMSPSGKTARFTEISDAPLPPTALPPTLPPPRSLQTDTKSAEPETASHTDLLEGPGGAVQCGTKPVEAPTALPIDALEGGAQEVQTDTKAAEPATATPIDPVEGPGAAGPADVAPDEPAKQTSDSPPAKKGSTLHSSRRRSAQLPAEDLPEIEEGQPLGDPGPSAATGSCSTDLAHHVKLSNSKEWSNDGEPPNDLPGIPDGMVRTPQLQSLHTLQSGDSEGIGMSGRNRSNPALRKSNFIAHENRRKVFEKQSKIQRLTESPAFESVSGFLILLNCLFVAWQTQAKALDDEFRAKAGLELVVSEPFEFTVLQGIFLVCFSAELGLRFMADKWYLFNCSNPNAFWNWLDLLVVTFDLVSIFLEVWVQFSLLRVIRVIRVIRVAKMIRVMRTFQELRLLMHSIISCIRSLIWVVAVLCLMLGMFSVMFTSAVGSTLDTAVQRRDPANSVLIEHFGTLDRSTINLYMAMTGGTDWSVQYDAMRPLPGIYMALFLLYITFSIYALANVVTGIFLENARNSGKRDREHVIAEELQTKTQFLHELQRVFDEMDANDSGTISKEEFESTLQDERVQAYFNAMKLDAREVEYLFALLDFDGSGEVSYSEFVDGCWKLQGEARSLDMKILQLEIESLSKLVHHVLAKVSTESTSLASWNVRSTAFNTAERFSRASRSTAPKEQAVTRNQLSD
mmetsp:Transcript_48873/g.114887  ORF Transcript_48873/g.114887 Transcript_48873/m.114887 type:complete len:765 (+) Transcript_48873:16-2310(+)